MLVENSLIQVQTLELAQLSDKVYDAVANCFAIAFRSGIWSQTPIERGDATSQETVDGILASLGSQQFRVVVATHDQQIQGFALEGLLCDELIEKYGLGEYGANPGDGLLPFAGLTPELQKCRIDPSTDSDRYRVVTGTKGVSLYGQLFSQRVKQLTAEGCQRLFIRTRKELTAVQRQAQENDFLLVGTFDVTFKGQRQDRMIYRRG